MPLTQVVDSLVGVEDLKGERPTTVLLDGSRAGLRGEFPVAGGDAPWVFVEDAAPVDVPLHAVLVNGVHGATFWMSQGTMRST
jgi:hypothetical protein